MKKGFALVMILPLFMVFFNNTVNRHQHILPDGMIVEHAHPLNSPCCCNDFDPGNKHKHTDREIILYTILTDSPVIEVTTGLIPDIQIITGSEVISCYRSCNPCNYSVSLVLLRAPPC